MKSILLLSTIIACIVTLPINPTHQWNPQAQDMEMFRLEMNQWKCAINEKRWDILNPTDWIAHDKFNIADGFDADIFTVEEILFKGDPVIKVEQEMSQKRSEQDKKDKKKLRGLLF